MNYFAHGRHYVDDPHFLAGTAVPDWLSVVDRKCRARAKFADRVVRDADSNVAAVARGVLQHLHDDHWFHATRAYTELNLKFTVAIRDLLADDAGFRPSFLGHILVELLLDAELIAEEPKRLDAYYEAIGAIDADLVQDAVNRLTTQPIDVLGLCIRRFSSERFLYDYLEDEKLLWRLNHVMRRVQLPPLPGSLCDFFPEARHQVRLRKHELLAGESPANLSNIDGD